jgi:hypothetical protein
VKIALIVISALVLLGVVGMAIFVFVVQNVEQPKYVALIEDGPFELRDYPAAIVAEVQRQGSRREALRAGFGPLAGYIFAKEREGRRISMTAPVTQAPDGAGDWTVRFFMPAAERLDQLPAPARQDVRLIALPARRMAAIRFSGTTGDDRIKAREAELRHWIEARGLSPISAPTYAYYNDPFTPGFLRRNEVLIKVASPNQKTATGK